MKKQHMGCALYHQPTVFQHGETALAYGSLSLVNYGSQ